MTTGTTEDLGKTPLSLALQATLVRAREYAAAQSHAQVTLEHLLLALTEDEDANAVLQSSGIDMARLRNDVSAYLGGLGDRIAPGSPAGPGISQALTEVLGYATIAAKQGRRQRIDGAIVLAALIGDGKSMAASFLTAQGLTFQEVVRVLQRGGGAAQPATTSTPNARPSPAPHPSDPRTAPPDGAAGPPVHAGVAPSRTEDILAAARERVESRTTPHGRVAVAGPQTPARVPTPHAPPAVEPSHSGPGLAHSPLAPSGSAPAPPPIMPRLHPSAETAGEDASPSPEPRPAPSWAPPPLPAPPSGLHGTGSRPSPGGPAPTANQGAPQPGASDGTRPPRPEPPWGEPVPSLGAQRPPSLSPSGAAELRRPDPVSPHRAPPAPPNLAPVPGPGGGAAAPLAAQTSSRLAPLDATQISHSLPRRMRLGRPATLEIRVGRPPMAGPPPGKGPTAFRSEQVVLRAISVRLRAGKPAFRIELLSPETQWDQSSSMTGRLSDEQAVWRFLLTPLAAGKASVHLLVSARTVAADGVVADMVLPELALETRVARNWSALARRIAVYAAVVLGSLAVVEGLEAAFGFELHRIIAGLVR